MKKIFIFIFFFISFNLYAQEIKFKKIADSFDKPWSLSFIDEENIIITEKSGKLYTLNLKNKKISEIKHNLSVLEVGQGGLLDVLYHEQNVYISYSENRDDWKTSTSVAKGKFDQKIFNLKIFSRQSPQLTLVITLVQD